MTARSLDILMKLNLEENQCLEMPDLEEDEARSIFLKETGLLFENEIDEKLIRRCIQLCHFCKADGRRWHYHPLALKVLGQQLGSNIQMWEVQLSKIDTINQLEDVEDAIFYIMRSSFASLNQKLQLIFMDLALILNYFALEKIEWLCIVHEESIEDMKDMLEILKKRSLLENLSDDFSEIGLHDLWHEFAILETKAQDYEDGRWVYHANGKKTIKTNRQWRENVKRMCFRDDGWKCLKELKLADFVNVEVFILQVRILVEGYLLDLDLSGLKHLKSLVVQTPGLIVRTDGLSSLTNLCYLLSNTPGFSPFLESIRHSTNLQFLFIYRCKGVKVLDLTQLELLQVIHIGDFPDLITIRGLNSRMANLRRLGVMNCKSLRECLGLDELYGLEELWILECEKLKELPYLGRLTKLKVLRITGNTFIKALLGIDELAALEKLKLFRCSKLATLPSLMKLTKLRELCILESPVQEVPGLDGLVGLVFLSISLGKLSREPPVLSNLPMLKRVLIDGWNGLIWKSIQNMLMLEEIMLNHCKGEDVVPDLPSLKRLRMVTLMYCNFKDLSGLSNSTTLEKLEIHYCGELERLPEIERLTNLSGLSITHSNNLRDWPSASNLGSLKQLEVDEFSLMKIVPDLDMLSGLRELELNDKGCEHVLNMASLSQLETLKLSFLDLLEVLDLSTFPQLTDLELWSCCNLERVTCSITLIALTELEVDGCKSLVEMPDLSTFPHLERLVLKNCSSITRLTCNTGLIALREIILTGCAPQIEISDISRLPKLRMYTVEEGSSSKKDDEDEDDDDDGDDHEDEEDMADGSR